MGDMQRVRVSVLLNPAEMADGRAIVHLSVGPFSDLVLLTVEQTPSGQTNRYRIHHQTSQWLNIVNLPETDAVYDFVQPLPPDRWLLVRRNATGPQDENASLYTADGRLCGSFAIGDDVTEVQTTADGQIWVHYGTTNPAANADTEQAALICFNAAGQTLFRLNESGRDLTEDCFCFNAAYKDEIWLYAPQRFALARLRKQKTDRVWSDLPVPNVRAFAVHRNHVLFASANEEAGGLSLLDLNTLECREIEAVDEAGARVSFTRAMGRGFRLYLCDEQALRALDMNDLDS